MAYNPLGCQDLRYHTVNNVCYFFESFSVKGQKGEILSRLSQSYTTMAANAVQRKWRHRRIFRGAVTSSLRLTEATPASIHGSYFEIEPPDVQTAVRLSD